MNKGRNRSALNARRYLQPLNVHQQLQLISVGCRNALEAIYCGWRVQVRRMNTRGAAMYTLQLYSIQNLSQPSNGLSLGFEGKVVQMRGNFTEIWASFSKHFSPKL